MLRIGRLLALALAVTAAPVLAQTSTNYTFSATTPTYSDYSLSGTFTLSDNAGTYSLTAFSAGASNNGGGAGFDLNSTHLIQNGSVIELGNTSNGVTTVGPGWDYLFSFDPSDIAGTLNGSVSGPGEAASAANFVVNGVSAAGAAPEPAAWALMILGFGLAGTALRRRDGRAGTVFAAA